LQPILVRRSRASHFEIVASGSGGPLNSAATHVPVVVQLGDQIPATRPDRSLQAPT
jgi:hypothetical protein